MTDWLYMPDTYEGDAEPDWKLAARYGVNIVGLKASEGASHVDVRHAQRTKNAHGYGMTVVHYHYCRPNGTLSQTQAEARLFWRVVKPVFERGDYLALDFETTGSDPASLATYIERFWSTLAGLSGHDALIYGSTSFLAEHTRPAFLRRRRVWQAQYAAKPDGLPRGARRWAWQFTNGSIGPEPHRLAGFPSADVSRLSLRVAVVMRLRARRRRRAVQKRARH